MIEYICDKDKCTGCSVCTSICPAKAIKMTYDDSGFYYPLIDADRCIDCGLCRKKCIANNPPIFQYEYSDYYLSWAKDDVSRKSGSSGGLFPVIAKWILQQGGYVVGAAFTGELKLMHTIIDNEQKLPPLCGSKYIQSETENIYSEIKELLQLGKLVLFVGTPCQVSALYTICGRAENLITCDLICYGVGSTSFFNACLHDIESKYQSKAADVKFREKIYGCRNSSFSVKFQNGKEYKKIFYLSDYGKAFSGRLINRKSCYDCAYCSNKRMGDFTLGDYTASDILNINNYEIKRGTSLFRINSEKGRQLFDKLSDYIYYENKDENMIMASSVRQKSEKIDKTKRDSFMNDFAEYGIAYVIDKYCNVSLNRYLMLRYDSVIITLRRIKSKIYHRGGTPKR